jgi:YVTN family beta-propeller protein
MSIVEGTVIRLAIVSLTVYEFPFSEAAPYSAADFALREGKNLTQKGERQMSRSNPWINCLLVGLLAAGLSVPALAQSVPFPTYQVGANQNGSQGPNYPSTLPKPWVVSNGQIITPAGTTVYLGITTRAKAIALNPNTSTHTAAVLQMGAPQAVTIFNTQTGAVLQKYKPFGTKNGSSTGITYTPDGKHLLFSQDSSYVAIANVDPTGMLTDDAHVSVPMDVNAAGVLTNVTCFPNSPSGTTGSIEIPCGQTVSIVSDGTHTSYPTGIAISADGKTAYVVLDNNDTLTKIDLTAATPTEGAEIRVGNVPHSVVISPDGTTAYVSNEAGRIATEQDFQGYSNGTPVVARYPEGSTATGTVSVVNLSTFTVTGSISTGLHPTGMAFWGKYLLVANAYSDSISLIDTHMNQEVRRVDLGLPIGVPGEPGPAYGAGPNSIAVEPTGDVAYVALYNANAVAVVDLRDHGGDHNHGWSPILGMIPVGYAPSSVVLDTADNALLVANDKGIGTTGYGVATPPESSAENSYATSHGVSDFNTHQDLGTVSIVPVPNGRTLYEETKQVFQNNHWDLAQNIWSAAGGNRFARPVAIPERIGDPSKIKHVFVIIRENRTYDQMLGDVAGGNGDASLAVFGDNATFGSVSPNAHALVQRFPLLDNFYDPSRQSADGHNWIVQAMAPYSDDIQSPDWLRDYPSNGGDALAYQKKGHLWDVAATAGVKVKNYGEYIEYNTFLTPAKNTTEPSWTDFYDDTLAYESGKEPQLYYYNTISSHTPLPNLYKVTVQNYPQFDLGIPDQFRFDIWNEDFQNDLKNGTVPQLEFMWISSDHTGGPPTAQAMQADNDLALGRFVDAISHSPIWSSSAIFVEEDDAQDGADHVDGHRSPGYVISPYVQQKVNPDGTGAGVTEDSTFQTQVNMTRTIEQILGLTPMNQFDLVASPMRTLFVDEPPANNFEPWSHVPNVIPLDSGVNPATQTHVAQNISPKVKALQVAWHRKKAEIFAGKYHTPDSEDPDTVNHLNWYESTGFKLPYPGEKTVRPPSDFNRKAPAADDDDDGI